MRHLARLQQPFGQGIAAGKELIFIACNLLWHMYGLNVGAVRAINRDGLGIVDIVDDKWFAYLLDTLLPENLLGKNGKIDAPVAPDMATIVLIVFVWVVMVVKIGAQLIVHL